MLTKTQTALLVLLLLPLGCATPDATQTATGRPARIVWGAYDAIELSETHRTTSAVITMDPAIKEKQRAQREALAQRASAGSSTQ